MDSTMILVCYVTPLCGLFPTRHLFYFRPVALLTPDVVAPTTKLCVSRCPDAALLNATDVQDFLERTGAELCRYDIALQDYGDSRVYDGDTCPSLPYDVT